MDNEGETPLCVASEVWIFSFSICVLKYCNIWFSERSFECCQNSAWEICRRQFGGWRLNSSFCRFSCMHFIFIKYIFYNINNRSYCNNNRKDIWKLSNFWLKKVLKLIKLAILAQLHCQSLLKYDNIVLLTFIWLMLLTKSKIVWFVERSLGSCRIFAWERRKRQSCEWKQRISTLDCFSSIFCFIFLNLYFFIYIKTKKNNF